MPIARVKVVAEASTDALLDTFQTAVEAEVPSQERDRPYNWTGGLSEVGRFRVLDVRFNTTNAADTFWSRLQTRLAILRAGGAVRGRISQHVCSHLDAVVVSCRDNPASAYREIVI